MVFRTQIFRTQIYCQDEEGVPSPLDPQDVYAVTHKDAAEAVCGKGLIEAGPVYKLAAKVWTGGRHPPDIRLFYRA
jgi:hypothetical protein